MSVVAQVADELANFLGGKIACRVHALKAPDDRLDLACVQPHDGGFDPCGLRVFVIRILDLCKLMDVLATVVLIQHFLVGRE